jgi:hypothetical protein
MAHLQDKSLYLNDFTQEQSRVLVNLQQHYEVWLDARRRAAALPYGMKWVTRGASEYLYELADRRGNARSLGPKSPTTAALHESFLAEKEAMSERVDASRETLATTCALYRALRLPLVPHEAAKVLREADLRGMLGRELLVVGTLALTAYSIEAGGIIQEAPDSTDDFDLTWSAEQPRNEAHVMAMLKSVDSTYSVNTERTFQARNSKAYEVELLAAPSTVGTMQRGDQISPIPLDEQEWLLGGRRVSHVAVASDGSPAPLAVPDPRLFALQKIWLSEQGKRSALKRPKDLKQGTALLNAVAAHMPHYPLDEEFQRELPDPLQRCFRNWQETYRPAPAGSW